MQLAEKQELVRLLNLYQADLTRELEKILEEELGNEDTKRHTC